MTARTREEKMAVMLGKACNDAEWSMKRFASELTQRPYAEQHAVFLTFLWILDEWSFRSRTYRTLPQDVALLSFATHLDNAARDHASSNPTFVQYQ